MRTKKSYPLSKVYQLLEPGPVVLVTSAKHSKTNIMTMSWHTMLDFEPPLLAAVISNRNYSFRIIENSKECVINIPTEEMAKKVVACGNTSGKKIDKIKWLKLTASSASKVKAPLIDECYANLECRVVDTKMVKKYNLFILKVVKAWINPKIKNPKTLHHRGNGSFMIAGKTIRLSSKMK